MGRVPLGFVCTLVWVCSASAEEGLWKSSVELGAVATSGNTEERNIKFNGDTARDGESMKHKVHLDALRNSRGGITTAQKYYAYYQLDFKLADNHSLYGRLGYTDDEFSGFNNQTDFTAGYARKLLDNDRATLDGSIGLGIRSSELATGEREDESIVRIAFDYVYNISESAVFKQSLSSEIGSDSTISRSETSLSANISGNLAMKVALNINNNSEVPVGTEKTDTETAITLVYSF